MLIPRGLSPEVAHYEKVARTDVERIFKSTKKPVSSGWRTGFFRVTYKKAGREGIIRIIPVV